MEGGDGQPDKRAIRRFVMGTVFDVSQTDADDGAPPAVGSGAEETAVA